MTFLEEFFLLRKIFQINHTLRQERNGKGWLICRQHARSLWNLESKEHVSNQWPSLILHPKCLIWQSIYLPFGEFKGVNVGKYTIDWVSGMGWKLPDLFCCHGSSGGRHGSSNPWEYCQNQLEPGAVENPGKNRKLTRWWFQTCFICFIFTPDPSGFITIQFDYIMFLSDGLVQPPRRRLKRENPLKKEA